MNINAIKEQLNKVREEKGQKPLDNKSLTKYATQIKNVYLDLFSDKDLKPDIFETKKSNGKYVLEDIKVYEDNSGSRMKLKWTLDKAHDKPNLQRGRALWNAITAYTGNKDFEKIRKDVNENHFNNKEIKKYEGSAYKPNEKESEAWVSRDEINNTINEYQKLADKAFKELEKDEPAKYKDIMTIQHFMLLLFTSGKYFSVRRSADYTFMRVLRDNFDDGVDFNTDNYYDKVNDELVFNTYKTSATKGRQKVVFDIMKKKENGIYTNGFFNVKNMRYFRKYLLKYLNVIENKVKSEYMFFKIINGQITQINDANITTRLNLIYNKKVGTNILRKSAISYELNKLNNLTGKKRDTQEERIKAILKNGGSSSLQLSHYGKKNEIDLSD